MNIKEAKQEIMNTVKAYLEKDQFGDYQIPMIRQRPLLLIGPPGIGKTQIMEQIARECKIGLVSYTITHHTRQSAIGLPFIKEEEFGGKKYSITEYTMSEIIASVYQKQKETGLQEGILFIDEINCVSETLAPTMLQFLQCKTFGNQKVPEGWIIVAAGNPPEYNKSVRDFDMVTLDRVRYMSVEADYYVWKEYAVNQNIHQSILSFLDLKPSSFYKVETDVDGMHFVTARGWEDLSNLIDTYEKLNICLTKEMVSEFLHHEDVAEDFLAYYELYKKYEDDYSISEVLKGRISTNVYARLYEASFDERVSIVNLLLNGIQNIIDSYSYQKYCTDSWYDFLKEYRSRLSTNMVESYYEELIRLKEDQLAQKKRANMITTFEYHRDRKLLNEIKCVSIESSMDMKEAFEKAKKPFNQQVKYLNEKEKELEDAFAGCFELMENAFSSGQEMVIFITGLATHQKSALYLSEHEVPLYEKYKEQLLIGTRRAQLLDELQH